MFGKERNVMDKLEQVKDKYRKLILEGKIVGYGRFWLLKRFVAENTLKHYGIEPTGKNLNAFFRCIREASSELKN